MSEHAATIAWERGAREFTYEAYSRDHTWSFDGGVSVPASAAPAYRGNPGMVDPEEALVAALSSCHMLSFLALAAKQKWVVNRYRDTAQGHLEKNAEGRLAITRVALRPQIEFGGERRPSAREVSDLHDQAHHVCFIASSVKTEVTVEPVEPAKAAAR